MESILFFCWNHPLLCYIPEGSFCVPYEKSILYHYRVHTLDSNSSVALKAFLFSDRDGVLVYQMEKDCSDIATLGSILDSQLIWESGKSKLARWSHEVEIFPERKPPSHPPSHPTIWIFLFDYLPRYPQIECAVSPPWLLKHLRTLCGVPTKWNVRCPPLGF